MNRDQSSTKWNRPFLNEPLAADCREIILNRNEPQPVKIAPRIQSSAYPNGQVVSNNTVTA